MWAIALNNINQQVLHNPHFKFSTNSLSEMEKKLHNLTLPLLQRGEIWFNEDSTLDPSPHQHSLQTHKFNFWILEHKIFTYILLDYVAAGSQAKCNHKFYVPESKNKICRFVGNVDADSGLTCYPH